jgi:hypothetical protein
MKTRKSNPQRAGNEKKSTKTKKSSPRAASSRISSGGGGRSAASSKSKKQPPGRSRDLERTRDGDKKLRNKPMTRPRKVPGPNPGDLERPAPNEPVRIQPPTPRFARSGGKSTASRRGETATPRNEAAAQAADDTTDAATRTHGPSSRDDETSPPNVDASARRAEMTRERRRVRSTPERQRGVDQRVLDANRWVHQRANQPRAGRWQAHGHASFRGR